MDNQRIVLAFTGDAASCAAVRWLHDIHQADVAALIVGVGQAHDLEEVRVRALACGAVRAHVVDRSEVFAREAIVSVIRHAGPVDPESLRRLAHPIIASALVEVAAIEGADAVAHASARRSMTDLIRAVDPTVRVIAPAHDWIERGVELSDYVARHHLSPGGAQTEQHLLLRRPLSGASSTARVTIGFEDGLPVSVNGVTMGLRDLIESVSVISGQYTGAGAVGAPALTLLQTAYAACDGCGSASVELQPLSIAVLDELAQQELVDRA